jgi:hypothetical protein
MPFKQMLFKQMLFRDKSNKTNNTKLRIIPENSFHKPELLPFNLDFFFNIGS